MTDVQTVPVVPGYSALRAVERDDYATVFEAESSRQRVRIVCLDARVRGQGQLTQAFLTQSRAIASLNHPAFLGVLDSASAGTSVYVIAEHVNGTLLDDLAGGAAPAPSLVAVAQIGAEVSRALAALHEAGLTHGDLTPRGIFLTPNGKVRITPVTLGCAARGIQPWQLCRRLIYQAPEALCQNNTLRVEPSADVYALAAVLWEIACGRSLARADTIESFVSAARRGLPPIPNSDRLLPDVLRNTLQSALDRDPDRRPSASELAEKLVNIAGSAGRGAVAAFAGKVRPEAGLPLQRDVWSIVKERPGTTALPLRASRLSLADLPRKGTKSAASRPAANWLRRLPRVEPRKLPPPLPRSHRRSSSSPSS